MKKLTGLFCVLSAVILAVARRPAGMDAAASRQSPPPTGQQNYARLYGTVSHLRRGGEVVENRYLGISSRRPSVSQDRDNREEFRMAKATLGRRGTTVTR